MANLNNIQDVNPLPPGWDCKFDNLTGKRYYINYFTRHTSMEDPRVHHTESIPLQDFTSNTRLGLMMGTNSLKRQQSESESCQKSATDQAVAKISVMFPTVTETHIRTLLLKYLKSVFPVVEETVLLDTLSSSENNVHRATQALLTMGFDKKSIPPPRVCLQRETPSPPQPRTSPHRMKSVEEKHDMKVRLRAKHPEVAERVVSIALDSVDFDESKADQILKLTADMPSENGCNTESGVGEEEVNEIIIEEPSQASSPQSPPSCADVEHLDRSVTSDREYYQSSCAGRAVGPDPSLRRGPNQALLLNGSVAYCRPDYVAWTGSARIAKGPNPLIRGGPSIALGPDPSLRKGPDRSLAKGSQHALRCN